MEGRIVWDIDSEPNMKETDFRGIELQATRCPCPYRFSILHHPFLECPNQGSKKVKAPEHFCLRAQSIF